MSYRFVNGHETASYRFAKTKFMAAAVTFSVVMCLLGAVLGTIASRLLQWWAFR